MNKMQKDSGRQLFPVAIGIPAYGRCAELEQLLQSIHRQTILPSEIVLCEDNSPEREQLREIAHRWRDVFSQEGCVLRFFENPRNLGYDGNVRSVIEKSEAPWVMLMGNDDLLLPHCVETLREYLDKNGHLHMISRSFIRFQTDVNHPLGASRIASHDEIFRVGHASAKMIIRASGFVGGLIINRDWAAALATDAYDGTLYYQLFLAAQAFCDQGIGFISRPIIAGRAGNAPLFGAADAEKGFHIPGSYTPKGRAKMLVSILKIVDDVGRIYGVDLLTAVKRELEVEKSFHIFEMYAGAPANTLQELRDELKRIGLFGHLLPRLLYLLNRLMGKHARFIYSFARRVIQREN